MNLPVFFAGLLLLATQSTAQINAEQKCLMNKQGELQMVEKYLEMLIQKSQQPEMVNDFKNRLEEINYFSRDLNKDEKMRIAYQEMMSKIIEIQEKIELYKRLPNCIDLKK